ncbi:MAG: hypothetical protein KGJ50_04865 [Xanthomonadaceae bacterium]|nr:hypothetical protein [Xanthomonadaceae bacterium]
MHRPAPLWLALFVTLAAAPSAPAATRAYAGDGRPRTIDTAPGPGVAPYVVPTRVEPQLSTAQRLALLRAHIRYVFVIYQENRSFDSYFGTWPGADGIYSQPPARTPGFVQPLQLPDGRWTTISPFRIGPAEHAADSDDIDHSHPLMLRKLHVVGGVPRMDRFALTEERKYSPQGAPSLRALQFGELAMAHEDCDTVPILWHYADRFALFDHVFQTVAGPSTPGNLSIIAAQTGVTQWARHPDEAFTGDGAKGPGVPVVDDADPLWGSPYDPNPAAQRMPYNPHDTAKTAAHRDAVQHNLTFATLPLTLQGGDLDATVQKDTRPETDLADLRGDVRAISVRGQRTVDWRWYQAGYGAPTPAGADPEDAEGQHASYVTHHNGPQYFGYIANNPALRAHLADLSRFFGDLRDGRLPAAGGVFYIKGGYRNDFGLKPADPDPRVQARFLGDDDHPQYSDAQISEILVARAINAIAASRYWSDSAIIVTWDDSEGDYDHVPPPQRNRGPDGKWLGNGPRVPLLLISPYARVHAVIHAPGNTASVVKFVDRVFDLPPLATLPDELEGRKLGELHFHLHGLGPEDALTPDVTDLLGAFDTARLAGRAAPLPASYAEVPQAWTEQLPGALGLDCKALGIVPVDRQLGIRTTLPPQFNPRPKTTPTPVSAAPR